MATGRVPTTANSPLTAKGDLFGYSTTQARVAVGNDGETLVADSSTSTGLRWQGDYAAGKNKIINGDFGVWQRGTSFSANNYNADRWNCGSDASVTISRQSFGTGTAPVSGYEGTYYCRVAKSSGGTYITQQQYIEDVRTFAGQTVTLSFWAKADATVSIEPYFIQYFGTGGSGDVNTALPSVNLTTSWARYTFTVAIPSISGKTIGTGSYLRTIAIRYIGSAATTIDYWGVQVEAGSIATPFQTATGTIQGELAACQRYYYRFTATGAVAFFGTATNPTTTQGNAWVQHPVTMRVMPTSVDFASLCIREASGTRRSMSSIILETGGTNTNLAFIYGTISGGTVNIPAQLTADNTTAGYIGFSAEL